MALTGRRRDWPHWLAVLLTAFVAYPIIAQGGLVRADGCA